MPRSCPTQPLPSTLQAPHLAVCCGIRLQPHRLAHRALDPELLMAEHSFTAVDLFCSRYTPTPNHNAVVLSMLSVMWACRSGGQWWGAAWLCLQQQQVLAAQLELCYVAGWKREQQPVVCCHVIHLVLPAACSKEPAGQRQQAVGSAHTGTPPVQLRHSSDSG